MERIRSFAAAFRAAEARPEFWIELAILEFTEDLVREMEGQGVSRTELARRLDVAPAYITRCLRGDANLTLASMVKMAHALGKRLHAGLGPAERAAIQSLRPAATTAARAYAAGLPAPRPFRIVPNTLPSGGSNVDTAAAA